MIAAPLLLGAVLSAWGAPAAGSPAPKTLAEAEGYLESYHLDPARIDLAKAFLEALPKRDAAAETDLCKAYFLIGDVRAADDEARQQAYDAGREAGKRAVELAPNSAEAHIWYAINVGRWGQTRGTLRSLFLLKTLRKEIKTVLELDPKHLRAHSLAGNIDLEVPGVLGGGVNSAEQHFRQALELDAHYTAARVGLAQCLIKQKKFEDARLELMKVINEKAPLVIAYWTVKDVPKASEVYDSLPDPATSQEWFQRGMDLLDQKRQSDAIAAFDRATGLDPKNEPAWTNRGTTLLNLGRYQEALDSYDKSSALKPDNPYIYCSEATVYNSTNRAEEAVAAAEKALTVDPNYAPAMANKAKALKTLGRADESKALFDKAFALDPSLKKQFE